MAKKISIMQFDGGITDDIRQESSNGFAMTQGFETVLNPNRMTPYRNVEANESKAFYITNFLYGSYGTGVGDNILALGVQNTQGFGGKPEIYMKTLSGGDTPVTGAWTTALASPGGTIGLGSNGNLFIEYKGYVYTTTGGRYISRWGDFIASGTGATMTSQWKDLTSFTTVAQGLIHRAKDILYIPYDNKIASLNNTTWNATALQTLPSDMYITSLCEYGNYVAIAMQRKDGVGNSRLYIWDGINADVTEVIDMGNGALKVIGNVSGRIIGVSVVNNSSFDLKPKIIIREYAGGVPNIIKILKGESSTAILYQHKVSTNRSLYFAANITIGGSNLWGIFAINLTPSGRYSVTLEQKINNDTNPTIINGMMKFGDIWFISYNGDGSVNRTNDQAVYSNSTSIYESQVFTGKDITTEKDLVAISVFTVALTSGQSITVKFRKNGDSSWTTIYSDSTVGSTGRDIIKIDSTGDNLPRFNEIQFRIESNGGAEITGYKFKFNEVNDVYGD